jgi:hypothetical protein
MPRGKIQMLTLNHEFHDCLDPEVFQNVISTLSNIRNMLRQPYNLDDLFILTNISNRFKDYLLKLEMDLSRLSITALLE